MTEYQDAFISYGRADSKTFAFKLYDRLRQEGLNIWFDFADIPLGVDYQKQIDDGIETTHNFLFIISPHSVHSPYCRLEIDLALRYKKRIIPLLHVPEISYETWKDRNPEGTQAEWQQFLAEGKHSAFSRMPPAISKINWIFFGKIRMILNNRFKAYSRFFSVTNPMYRSIPFISKPLSTGIVITKIPIGSWWGSLYRMP